MNFFRLLPVFLSFLLLAAHFFRAGQTALAVLPLLLLVPLALRKTWVPWLIQLALLLGGVDSGHGTSRCWLRARSRA